LDPEKLVVGLTGMFGSGKSSALQEFKRLGAFVLDADRLAHEALGKTSPVFNAIADRFKEALDPVTGTFDRAKLAAMIFRDPDRRRELEGIVHPYVLRRMEESVRAAYDSIAVLEVALLYESGFAVYCDKTIVITAETAEIEKRLKAKEFSVEEIQARLKIQMPGEEKEKRADFIIENSGEWNQTRAQIEVIWNQLRLISKGVT